jgi:hypothetical protein
MALIDRCAGLRPGPRGQEQGRDHPLPEATPRPRDVGPPPPSANHSPDDFRGSLTDIGASTPWPRPSTR